jgi:hypothetical protein
MVLHQCIRPLLERVVLRAIMDISAHVISLPDRLQRAIWVTSVRVRREDRSSISSHLSRRPRQVVVSNYISGFLNLPLDDQTDGVGTIELTSKLRPRARTLQAMRASLFASAIASTLRCNRFVAASIQDLRP